MAKFCEGCGHPLEDNAQFCDKCGRKTGAKCLKCGAAMQPGEAFCPKCGTKAGTAGAPQQPTAPQAAPTPRQTAAQPAQRPATPPPVQQGPAYAYNTQPPKKSKTGLIVGISLGAVALVAVIVGLGIGLSAVFSPQKATPTPVATIAPTATPKPDVKLIPFPDSLKVSPEVKVHCEYNAPESIIPANYRSLENIVFMTCYTDMGKTQLMVSVEIPGFTQKYEQMVDVSRAETELSIRPPLLADVTKSMTTSKDAQLVVSVTDMGTNKVLVQDSKPIKLYSRNDIQWAADDGTPYEENILAWVTPEAPEIDMLLRDTADSLNYLTNGQFNSIVGYQHLGDLSEADGTYYQVASMMYTLASTYQVKYIMDPRSSGSQMQSVKTPAEVINTRAGLCVETATTMASAIQCTNMHAVIILLPGHSQVAVETWPNSGEYLLIETTALDATRAGQFGQVVTYMTKDQWTQYMAQDGYDAIDCALAEPLNIQSVD